MSAFLPKNPDFEARVRESFAQQKAMATIGVSITSVEPGLVALEMPFNADFGQQHGFLHAGIITAGMDSAAGYAAFSLMPVEAEVLTVELKTNLMSPAAGTKFRFEGRVIKPGRTITFTEASAIAIDAEGNEKPIATFSGTMMAVIR